MSEPTKVQPAAAGSMRLVACLAIGTFAIGAKAFVITALLPDMALDLGVSLGAAGQLMTVYALAYALSSPVLIGSA